MAEDVLDVEDVAEDDNFVEVYRRAIEGDENACTDLWKRFRHHSHNIIWLKAADLSLKWAVDPDEIYDSFFVALLTRTRPIQFQDEIHLTCYIEKSVRRATKRSVRSSRNRCEVRLEDFGEIAIYINILDELVWQEKLEVAREELTDRERWICELVTQGATWKQVGRHLDLAEDAARKIYRRAIDRICHRHVAVE